MMGLFDYNTPQGQGLLAGSMALLNAGGPNRMPVSFGQALGQGFGAGQQAYQQAMKQKQDEQEFALQKQYRDAQIQKMQAEEARKAQEQNLISEFMKGGADHEKFVSAFSVGGNAPMAALAQRRADEAKAEREKQSQIKSMQSGPADTTIFTDDGSPAAIHKRPEEPVSNMGLFGPLLKSAMSAPAEIQNEVLGAANRNEKDKFWAPKDRQAEYVRLAKVIDGYKSRSEKSATVTEIVQDGKRIKIDANTGRKIGDSPTTGAGDIPKLKQGERWNAVNEVVEAVPGSDLYIKQSGLHSKDYNANQTAKIKFGNAIDKIQEFLDPKNKDAFKSNFGGYTAELTKYTPGAANTMRNKIESTKADLKSAGLELMRSGGSIGQMTEREWPIVERVIANITPQLDEKTARTELQRVINYLEDIKNNAQDVYETEWGQSQYLKSGAAPGSIPNMPNGWTVRVR